jgi:hypothetical protein
MMISSYSAKFSEANFDESFPEAFSFKNKTRKILKKRFLNPSADGFAELCVK